jgi:hypothetical protein
MQPQNPGKLRRKTNSYLKRLHSSMEKLTRNSERWTGCKLW